MMFMLLQGTKGRYAVASSEIRLDELPGFQIDGELGAMVQHDACPNCD